MISADYIVVGSGLTGATIARTLADAGREVVVLERRAAVGGNVRDAVHEPSGIRYHCHGPHYFRTNSDRIWEWAQRFAPFYRFEARVLISLDGRLLRWPLRDADKHLRQRIEDAYNLKMWGTADVPREISQRVEVRRDEADERLKTDKHQGLPRGGYSAWMEEVLRDVPVVLNYPFYREHGLRAKRRMIYTGPIDELFACDEGRLRYRCQRRRLHWLPGRKSHWQLAPQINTPEGNPWGASDELLRSIEWNWLSESSERAWSNGSLMTFEAPDDPRTFDEAEYPFNDEANKALAARYRERALAAGIVPCGRLGSYRYLDMDAAIGAALKVAEGLLR